MLKLFERIFQLSGLLQKYLKSICGSLYHRCVLHRLEIRITKLNLDFWWVSLFLLCPYEQKGTSQEKCNLLLSYVLPISRTVPWCSNCIERGSLLLDIPWLADMHGRSSCICRETFEEEWLEWGLGGAEGDREELGRGEGCKNNKNNLKKKP